VACASWAYSARADAEFRALPADGCGHHVAVAAFSDAGSSASVAPLHTEPNLPSTVVHRATVQHPVHAPGTRYVLCVVN
jgi:hypothetical protein